MERVDSLSRAEGESKKLKAVESFRRRLVERLKA